MFFPFLEPFCRMVRPPLKPVHRMTPIAHCDARSSSCIKSAIMDTGWDELLHSAKKLRFFVLIRVSRVIRGLILLARRTRVRGTRGRWIETIRRRQQHGASGRAEPKAFGDPFFGALACPAGGARELQRTGVPVHTATGRQTDEALTHAAFQSDYLRLTLGPPSELQNHLLGRLQPAYAPAARLHRQFLQFAEDELLGLADVHAGREKNFDNLRCLARNR